MGELLEKDGQNPSMGLTGSKPPPAAAQNTERFYGVHIPNSSEEDFLHVYEDKAEALKVVKHHKKARFKAFKQRSDAVAFAVHGADSSCTTSEENVPVAPSVAQSDAEKPSLFKGPKQQDMVQLRRAIESGNLELVFKTVWDNPRFLISSGDTPSILQEGSRYNALHVAAKSKNAAMADLILQTVGDPAFSKLLYGGDETLSVSKMGSPSERSAILVDLYLNTPDKGMHETPLHFAAKFGAIHVVATLVSYSQCDWEPKNKFGQRPIDIACTRCPTASEQLKLDIAALLQNDYYVPVLRADDNSLPPSVGTPYSPKEPPVLNEDPLSPRLEIHAFAGPMSQSQASEFHRLWRTPQRANSKTSTLRNAPKSCPTVFRLQDMHKGLERVGRYLALDHCVPWKEYWPFLNTFVDLTSHEGLALLEEYLAARYQSLADVPNEKINEDSSTPNSTENSVDAIKVNNTLDNTDIEPEILSPVTQLCSMMNACTILDDSMGSGLGRGSPLSLSPCPTPSSSPSNGSILSSVGFFDWLGKKKSEAYKTASANSQNESILNALSNPTVSPFLYVEKSLQLFAKRIAASLHHTVSGNFNAHHLKNSIRDVLRPEIKRVQSLVTSYMEDARFVAVDYHLVHSRIASSVAERLVDLLTWEEREVFYNGLQEILSGKGFDATFSSDDDDLIIPSTTYRQPRASRQSSGSSTKTAIRCVISQMVWALDQLQGSGPDGRTTLPPRPQVRTESECLEMWSDAYPCLCSWFSHNHANFSRGSRKSSSMKRSTMNTSLNESHSVSRRLDYTEKEDNSSDLEHNHEDAESHTSDGEGETFFTPPSSPGNSPIPPASESSSDDEMDVPEEGPTVFIEGSEPTRIDIDVLNAISSCSITQSSHPHIYRWRHEVLLHPSEERKRWQTQRVRRINGTLLADSIPNTPTQSVKVEGSSTPLCSHLSRAHSPFVNSPVSSLKTEPPSTPSWHRITGMYSPSPSKAFKRS